MNRIRTALWLLLASSFLLNLAGIGWGLPADKGAWDYDEITPEQSWGSFVHGVAREWPVKYPPLHFWMTALPLSGASRLLRSGVLADAGVELETVVFLTTRLVSVFLGTLSVLMVYLAGKEIFARGAAVLAAGLHAVCPTVVFYSKLGNLDIPYVFWFSVALVFFLRLLQRHRLKDYIAFALAAMASICTKDQAYALYVFTPILVLVSLARHRRSLAQPASIRHLLFDRRILWAVALAVVLFLIVHDVLRNPEQFQAHFHRLTGPYSQNWAFFPRTPAGLLDNMLLTGRNLAFSAGWPMLIAGLAGSALALVSPGARSSRLLLAALSFALSYVAAFLAVIFWCYDRFTLPITLVLALTAGHFFWMLAVHPYLGVAGRVLASATLLYGALRCGVLDQRMLRDSRIAVEDWALRQVPARENVFALGDPQMSPRFDVIRRRSVVRARHSPIDAWSADWLVYNKTEADSREFLTRQSFRRLIKAEGSFRHRFLVRYRPGQLLLNARGTTGSLVLVSPELVVLERRPDPALGGIPLPPGMRLAPATAEAARERRRGHLDQACAFDELAIHRDPTDVYARLGRGEDARISGDLHRAHHEFEQASRLAPGLASTWLGLARIASAQKQIQVALDYARTATDCEPGAIATWLALAEAEWAAGRRAASFAALDQAEGLAQASGAADDLESVVLIYRRFGARGRATLLARLAHTLSGEPGARSPALLLEDLLREQGREAENNWLRAELSAVVQ